MMKTLLFAAFLLVVSSVAYGKPVTTKCVLSGGPPDDFSDVLVQVKIDFSENTISVSACVPGTCGFERATLTHVEPLKLHFSVTKDGNFPVNYHLNLRNWEMTQTDTVIINDAYIIGYKLYKCQVIPKRLF